MSRFRLPAIKLSENTRQTLFAMSPIVMFGTLSAQLWLGNEADWFARLGSLIVAWALIGLSMRREKYSNYIWRIERDRIFRVINLQVDKQDLRDESLHLTFDLHASQIAQIGKELGKPNPFVENDDKAIKDFCLDVEKRRKEARWPEESSALMQALNDADSDFRKEFSKFSAWRTFVWRFEVLLIIWGTLQWGYGDLAVTWYHSKVHL